MGRKRRQLTLSDIIIILLCITATLTIVSYATTPAISFFSQLHTIETRYVKVTIQDSGYHLLTEQPIFDMPVRIETRDGMTYPGIITINCSKRTYTIHSYYINTTTKLPRGRLQDFLEDYCIRFPSSYRHVIR